MKNMQPMDIAATITLQESTKSINIGHDSKKADSVKTTSDMIIGNANNNVIP